MHPAAARVTASRNGDDELGEGRSTHHADPVWEIRIFFVQSLSRMLYIRSWGGCCSAARILSFGCNARKKGSFPTGPTSPRREASLLDLPGLKARQFFSGDPAHMNARRIFVKPC